MASRLAAYHLSGVNINRQMVLGGESAGVVHRCINVLPLTGSSAKDEGGQDCYVGVMASGMPGLPSPRSNGGASGTSASS